MSEQVMVELRLIEQTFRLATTSDKREELERAAGFSMKNSTICAVVHLVLSIINLSSW